MIFLPSEPSVSYSQFLIKKLSLSNKENENQQRQNTTYHECSGKVVKKLLQHEEKEKKNRKKGTYWLLGWPLFLKTDFFVWHFVTILWNEEFFVEKSAKFLHVYPYIPSGCLSTHIFENRNFHIKKRSLKAEYMEAIFEENPRQYAAWMIHRYASTIPKLHATTLVCCLHTDVLSSMIFSRIFFMREASFKRVSDASVSQSFRPSVVQSVTLPSQICKVAKTH